MEPEKSQRIGAGRNPGALTRSTVGSEPVPPQEEVLDDVLHWVWSWRLQIKRIGESFNLQGAGNNDVERRQSWSRFSYDEHILAVTGGNLVRAIARAEALFPEIKLSDHKGEALRLLRNLYEHWDEQRPSFRASDAPKKRSGADFARNFPEGRPWTMVFDKDDWFLCGVVPLNVLTRELATIEKMALELEARRRTKK